MDRAGSSKGRYLLVAALAPDTQQRYRARVVEFMRWCIAHDERPLTLADLDDVLCDYVHHLHTTGGSKSAASHTLYGIMAFVPRARRALPTASRAVNAWHKLEPARPYPPLTWEVTVAAAAWLHRRGEVAAAIGTLLAFDCMLRVGELCGLRKEDVIDASSGRLGAEAKGVALRLARTKTGPNKFVLVANADVARLACNLAAHCRSTGRVFGFSTGTYRTLFKSACAALGVSERYVPHSLRHGGATRMDLAGIGVEDIMKRGRWESSKSARRYIQSGKALLATIEIPAPVLVYGRVIAARLLTHFTLTQKH
jgi:integrase